MVQLNGETEINRLKSALRIVYQSCQKVIEQAEIESESAYRLTEKSFFKLKGNLQFLASEFDLDQKSD